MDVQINPQCSDKFRCIKPRSPGVPRCSPKKCCTIVSSLEGSDLRAEDRSGWSHSAACPWRRGAAACSSAGGAPALVCRGMRNCRKLQVCRKPPGMACPELRIGASNSLAHASRCQDSQGVQFARRDPCPGVPGHAKLLELAELRQRAQGLACQHFCRLRQHQACRRFVPWPATGSVAIALSLPARGRAARHHGHAILFVAGAESMTAENV